MAAVRERSVVHRFKTAAGSYNLISGVALNATQADRTLTLKLGSDTSNATFETVTIGVDYTYAAATTVTATCYGSLDGGTTYKNMQSSSVSTGTDTLSNYVASKTTGGANQSYSFTLNVDNYSHIKVIFSGASAGSSDLITVQAAGGCA